MGAERKTWIDVARGTAIISVTLMHVGALVQAAVGTTTGVWPVVNDYLLPLRMPLFFFIAGMLAGGAVRRPLSETRGRTLGLLYVYVVWSGLQLLHLVYSLTGRGDPLPEAYDIVASFLAPTGLWFLWALVTYFLVARGAVRLLGRFAPWALVPVLAVSVATPFLQDVTRLPINPEFGLVFFGSVYANAVWFFAGLFGRGAVSWLRSVASAPRLALALVGYLALFETLRLTGLMDEYRWIASGVAVTTAITALAVLPLTGTAAAIVAGVGRRTLPVYATQWIFLHLISRAVVDTGALSGAGHPGIVASVVTPLLTAAVVGVSWAVGGLSASGPLSWLFQAPRWLIGSDTGRKPHTGGPEAGPVTPSASRPDQARRGGSTELSAYDGRHV